MAATSMRLVVVVLLVSSLTVAVHAQVLCRASANCGDLDDLGEKTIEECCLNTPNGLAISEGEVCTPCIVFGFINDSFAGVEQGQGYSVQVGYLKGASVGTNLFFNVRNTPGTAREGAQFDYTVSTTSLRVLSSRPDPPEAVSFIFRADSIAQETNETLTLELEPTRTIPAGSNVFFKRTIRLTIIDSDEVGVFFTEDDFRRSERNNTNPNEPALMPVLVTKNSRIANPIVLDVIPLTVGMARANANSLLPDNIPPDNPFSPPFADLNDFNNATKRITFDPDEDANDNERAAPIRLFNDAVNEADEQVFVVQLHLINSTNPGSVILDERPASLCRIIDDDIIRIGFEVPRYTYMEPEFDEQIDSTFKSPTNLTSNGPIYLAKENNVQSEQTFRIVVQAADSVPPNTQNINPAMIGVDYSTGVDTAVVVDFLPFKQRVNFMFTLFPDTFPEGTEAFRLSSSAEDNAEIGGKEIDLPGYLPPQNLHAETFVLIEDDDSIIIGFVAEKYNVNESMGMLQINVSVFSPPVGEELFATIDLVVQSVAITANGSADYEELDINSPDFNVFLRFDDMNRWQTFDVTIYDDVLLEYTEDFNLELRFDPFVTPPSVVKLSPNVTTVCIQDDDNVTIGFIDPPYSVDENDGQVLIPVGVLSGALQREVVVNFSTSDSTAIDGTDYNQVQSMLLTFNSTSTRIDIPVAVINNDVYELTETFNGILSFLGDPDPDVALSPAFTEVIISDDDELSFGFQSVAYSVNEGAGPAVLSIVFSGDAGDFVPHVITSTTDGTATGSGDEADYTPVVTQAFSFTNSDRNWDLSIDIVSDAFTEDNETFSVTLDSVFLATEANGQALTLSDQERARLIRDPDTANVTILDDDDEAVIGFLNTNLSVSEDDGELGFDIGVISGILRISVTVNFITNDGNAHAGQDYNETATSLVFFDQSSQSVPVGIIDDDLFESPENFIGLLSNAGELPPNVQLAPTQATATILDNDDIIIGFDPTTYEVNENGGTVTLTVKVLKGFISEGLNIPIRVTTAGDSAQAPEDYGDISEIVTFSSGSTEHTVVVNIVDDNLLEINELFTAKLGHVSGDHDVNRIVLNPVEAPVTILDNDTAVIGFDPIMYNVTEGVDRSVSFIVSLISGELGRNVIVSLNTQSGTATSDLDFGGIASRQLVFSPTVDTMTVSVNITDDNFLELPIETFSANLMSTVPRLSLSPDMAMVDIADDDNVIFGFDNAQYPVVENASFVTVTIRQVSGAILNRNVHITLTTGDGTAVSSGERDFEAHSVDLIFGPGNTEQNVMIAIIDDLRLEHDEQFNSIASLTVADPFVDLNPADASIIIIDDDVVVIGFNQTLYEVREDVGQAVVYVALRNGILRRQVVVEVSTTDDTALDGIDYTGVVPRLLTFDMNNSEFPIAIDIRDDDIHELDERFFGRLSTVDEDGILEPGQTTVRIRNDDVVTFAFRQPVYMFLENVGIGSVCVDKIGSTDQDITVTVNGEIQSGSLNRMLVFPSDLISSCIDFQVNDDDIALEPPQEFIWTLAPIPMPGVELGINSTRLIIMDDDRLTLNLEKSEDIPEAIGTARACVTFSNPFATPFEIVPSVRRPNNSVAEHATPGVDYNDVIPSITSMPGNTEACFDIFIVNDNLVEEDIECFMASFTADDLDGLIIGNNSALCCIIDDDNVTIGFQSVDYAVNENEGTVTIRVQLLVGELARPVEVDFTTEDGTATSTAPADYMSQALPVTLQFTPDDGVEEVVVRIINDDIVENVERFAGVLSTIDRAVILNPGRASVEITEDPNDAVTIGFDPTEYVVSENDGSETLTVRMTSGVLERNVTVFFQTNPGFATSADPADYERTTRLLTFTPTVNVNQVSVTIFDDDIRENSEIFFAQLDAESQPVVTNPDLATVTILDDIPIIEIGFERTEYNVSEGEEVEVCAVLTLGTLEKNVEVSVASFDVTANVGSDYIAVNQTLVFNASVSRVCFTTSSLEDDLLEDNEIYRLTLTSNEPGLTLNPSEATVTIKDDGFVTIGLTETVFEVTEGDGALVEVCARVTGELEREAEVTLQTMDGSAVSQGIESDYQALTARLTFTSSITKVCRNITIINDVFYEDSENFNVQLTTEDTGVVVNPDMGSITIVDGDAVVIGFVQSTYTTLENRSQTVCARLRSGTLRTDVTVVFSTSDGDAKATEDYTQTSTDFVFNNGQQQNCVDIPIIYDNIIEDLEKFSGNLATSALRVTLMPESTEISINESLSLVIGFVDQPYETREESGFATVSVAILTQNVELEDDFVVRLQSADLPGFENSASADDDYQPVLEDLTFNRMVKRIDFNVTITDDDIVESNEVFSVNLTKVTEGPDVPDVVLEPANAVVTILDEEDTITIGVTETLITVNESVGVRQVCAAVFGDLGRRAEATLHLNPRTAMSGVDYETASFVLLFDATNKGPICSSVVIRDDGIYEFGEELTFNLTTLDQSVILNPAGGVLVIQDDDEIVIGWDQGLYVVKEDIGQARLCASVLQGSLNVTLPVLNIATKDGSALHGGLGVSQDYIPVPTPNQIVFSTMNQGSMCTNAAIVDDPFLEVDENFFADLSFDVTEPPDRVTFSPATTEVVIEDNDVLVIGFQPSTYTVRESVGDAELEVVIISGSLDTDIVVRLTTADDSAVSPDDYASENQLLTFNSSVAQLTVPVSIVDDNLDEIDLESFNASLVLVTVNDRVTISPELAKITIEDTDVVVIGFEETTYFTTENNTREVTVCASIRPGSPALSGTSVEVGLASMDGSAIAPGDYNAVSTVFTFDEGTDRGCVTFTGAEDDVVDPNENFTVVLTGGNDVILTPDTAVVTIVDQISVVVGFVEHMYTFIENQNMGTIQVRKNEASNVPFQVRVFGGPSTSSPIQQSAAAIDETITFGAGPSAADVISIQIPITNDDIALEATESYDVNLEIVGSPPNVVVGRYETTTVNVLDEDIVNVGFGSSGVTVIESSEEFTMCVVKDRVAVQDVNVTIDHQDETAISDMDYRPSGIPETVTIPASSPRACFTGPVIDDLIALESNETFTLTISSISPDTNRIQRGIETTRITIADDDIVRVRFQEPNYLFREESGLATVCVVKDLETATGFDVETVTSDNTAKDGSDYVGGPFSVNFGTRADQQQCREIPLIVDNEREDREDFFVDLTLGDTGGIRRGVPSRTVVAIEDTGIPVNDTVIGDPLMTVPILVRDEDLQKLNATRLSLCYEIHGRADTNLNLVTDECATVNAHYTDLTSYLNVIDQIGVRAIDNSEMCKNIQVNVEGCSALVDGVALEAGQRYDSGGISVRRYSNRVRISVPNCNELSLVMWVICETRTIDDPFGQGPAITGNMIKFVVMRGLNFGHRHAHGILGQFWNVPVSVEPFTGVDRNGNPVPQRYVVNITSTWSNEMRSYTGWLYDLTWSFEEGPCLYVGNRQAGPIYEVKDPNDPIIEGRYYEYLVPDLFSEGDFAYSMFDEDTCRPTPPVVLPTPAPVVVPTELSSE